MARDWGADMTNWNMYTPWPFAELFQDLEDKVEIRDYSHYNFVTPIIKPDNMTREEVLQGVLRNYARFYGWKFLEYWFVRDPFKRRYLLGCLWAFVTTTLNKRFYNLGRIKRKGMHAEIEFGFDQSRILSAEEMAERYASKLADVEFRGDEVSACGGPGTAPEATDDTETDVQVVIVDADEPRRIELRKGLRSQEGIEVASEATNGETGLVLLDSIYVDVVVVDATLPDMSITQFIQRVRGMETPFQSYKLLVLADAECDFATLDQQQVAYCPRHISMAALARAVVQVQEGQRVKTPAIVA
jgi:anaerobic magnesium-protoporphyrin IX monomethyl ester cyclase